LATVKRLKAGGRDGTGSTKTLAAIQKALEAKGVVVLGQNNRQNAGVRLRKRYAGLCGTISACL
jgi:hypothetical protein